MDVNGNVFEIVDNVGGIMLGRFYVSGNFSIFVNGKIVYIILYLECLVDIVLFDKFNVKFRFLIMFNEDLLVFKMMVMVEEINYKFLIDGRVL